MLSNTLMQYNSSINIQYTYIYTIGIVDAGGKGIMPEFAGGSGAPHAMQLMVLQ